MRKIAGIDVDELLFNENMQVFIQRLLSFDFRLFRNGRKCTRRQKLHSVHTDW